MWSCHHSSGFSTLQQLPLALKVKKNLFPTTYLQSPAPSGPWLLLQPHLLPMFKLHRPPFSFFGPFCKQFPPPGRLPTLTQTTSTSLPGTLLPYDCPPFMPTQNFLLHWHFEYNFQLYSIQYFLVSVSCTRARALSLSLHLMLYPHYLT